MATKTHPFFVGVGAQLTPSSGQDGLLIGAIVKELFIHRGTLIQMV